MRKGFMILFIIFALSICGCATPGKESFNLGQDLAKQNRWEEAKAMFEDALAKEPQNTEYLEALKRSKEALSARHMEKARSILAQTPITYDKARSAYQEAEKALSLVPKSKDAESLVAKVKSELDSISKKAEVLYSEATKAIEENEWVDGVKKLREINNFYPTYLDVTLKLRQAEAAGISYYLNEAEKFKRDEDWGKVIKTLLLAQEISPDSTEIITGLKDARAKHNPDYYLARAEEHATKNDWNKAIGFAQMVLNLGPADNIMQRIAMIRQQAGLYYINQCRQDLSEKRLYTAYEDAIKALNYDPSIKNEQGVAKVINQLLSSMDKKAASYETNGQLGNALVWYEKIISINQDYPDIFFKIQTIKDTIRERAVRKIAIMDFIPPSGNPDAGRIVTDSLLSYVTTHASSDVKILARDVLGAILKEIELGQAGLYDIESAKKAGKLKGTDVFIFGSVVNYSVERNVSEGYKVENVVVGKKSIPNPAYQIWLISIKGKPSEEEMRNAPPATIAEEIRETVRYKVGTERKRATVGVSFRIIDVEEGEVIITKTIKKSNEVKDDYSEGVAFANIKFDPLEIPSDAEVIDKVTEDVVAELGYEVLSRFQNLQIQYSNAAEKLKKKREYERAIEKYIDAIHIEEAKNISGPLSENARKEIEQLLKQIAS